MALANVTHVVQHAFWNKISGLSCKEVYSKIQSQWLVGGLEHEWMIFPSIGNFIIPTDEVIFFRGVPSGYLT